MLGMSSVSKIMATEEMVKNFTFMNLLPYLSLLGVVELAGVVMLIIPKTSKYGAVLLSSYLSGAVALHLAMMGGTQIINHTKSLMTLIFIGGGFLFNFVFIINENPYNRRTT